MLPFLAFVFGTAARWRRGAAVHAAAGRSHRPAAHGIDLRSGGSPAGQAALAGADRRVQENRRQGAAVSEGDGYAAPAPGAGRLPPRRSADDLLRHPRAVRGRAVPAPVELVDHPAEHAGRPRPVSAWATCCRGMVLARLAKRRAHRIRLSLADALDLLVVSVEAGLGLDQALTRVGHRTAVRVSGARR